MQVVCDEKSVVTGQMCSSSGSSVVSGSAFVSGCGIVRGNKRKMATKESFENCLQVSYLAIPTGMLYINLWNFTLLIRQGQRLLYSADVIE